MEDYGEVAAKYVRGSFLLLIGNFISLLVLAAGSILVARMLSPSEYGLYSVSMVLPELFLLFSDWGINSALTRFLVRYRSEGEKERMRRIWRAAILFKLFIGCVLSLSLFLSADVLTSVLLKRSDVGDFVRLASLLVLSRSLFFTILSALSGIERMDMRAVTNVIMAVSRGIVSPFLVYMGYGVYGTVVGQVSSYLAASLLGGLFVVTSIPHQASADKVSLSIRDEVGLMLGYGIPLFIGGLVAGFSHQLRGFLLSWFVSYTDIGNYHVAVNFTRLVSLFTGALRVTFFPAFSRLNFSTEPAKTRQAFQASVRYSSMFLIPMICFLLTVSEPMVNILYTTKYPQASFYLSLLLIPILLVGAGRFSTGAFLDSQGDTGTNMRKILVGSVVSILIAPVFMWKWGVFGLGSSIIVSSIASNVVGLYALNQKYGLLPDLRYALRTLLGSTVSAGLSFGVVRILLDNSPLLSLVLGSGVYLLAFLVLAPFMKIIENNDIDYLDTVLKGLVVIYPIARLVFEFERKIFRLMHVLRGIRDPN